MKITVKEFADVAASMRYTSDYREHFRNDHERLFAEMYKQTEDDLDHAILAFVERLYISNAVAFAVQYGEKPITIERLEEKDLEGSLLGKMQFWKTLRSIRYNLYTNAGRAFTSSEDMEKLDRFINTLAFELANRGVEG
jgi:hypothetical protein